MRKYSDTLRVTTNNLMEESDKLLKDTMNMMPSSEIVAGIDPQTFEVLQRSVKLVDTSKAVVAAQLEYYEGLESKMDEILSELKELKQLQATNKVAKEK